MKSKSFKGRLAFLKILGIPVWVQGEDRRDDGSKKKDEY